ncbi:MAG TPA: sugar MFS transporter, partial [Bacteroidota bacterium]|nr:sugar MFS transporter [Bacteroidota bacterium]
MASTAPAPRTFTSTAPQANYTPALTVLTSLFFMWGFITCLNDILIPHLKSIFDLNYTQSMLIQFTFFTAYFLVSLPSGMIIERIGYKRGIVIGLIAAGIGCLMFYPAAGARSYPLFLTALFVLASGITLLQVSANPYVAILGKPETASSRLNLTQAFNSLGTTIAPLFGSFVILSAATEVSADVSTRAAAVQVPYLGLAAALFIIAAVIGFFKLPEVETGDIASSDGSRNSDSIHASAWSYRHLVLGAVGIFMYVGGEVSIGSFLVSYMKEPTIAGFSDADAGRYLSFYWGGAMIGRFIGAALLQKIKAGKLLAFNAAAAALLVAVSMLTTGSIAMWSILAVGLFNSIMFPTIFTLGVDGLGKHTGQGSGILCMAIVGGALVPLVQGVLADMPAIGIQHAFFIPVLCYAYILYY